MQHLPDRVLAVVVAAICAAGVVTVVAVSTRATDTFDRDSPEWTVQAYLAAFFEEDNEKAATFFAPDSRCDVLDMYGTRVEDDSRVELVDTAVDGDRARVKVTVSIPSEDLFTNSWTENHTYQLTRPGEEWLLTGPPWPLYDCEGFHE